MKFCNVCNQMTYVSVREDDEAKPIMSYYCKNCGFTEDRKASEGSECIIENNYSDDIVSYKQYMNPYIKFDLTLPRVKNIACVNKECTKPKDKDNEVIYIKYDSTNMKFLYHCCYCDSFWRTDDFKVINNSS